MRPSAALPARLLLVVVVPTVPDTRSSAALRSRVYDRSSSWSRTRPPPLLTPPCRPSLAQVDEIFTTFIERVDGTRPVALSSSLSDELVKDLKSRKTKAIAMQNVAALQNIFAGKLVTDAERVVIKVLDPVTTPRCGGDGRVSLVTARRNEPCRTIS